MRATEALEFITNRKSVNMELLTHYDPKLNLEDTKEAKKKFRAKVEQPSLEQLNTLPKDSS